MRSFLRSFFVAYLTEMAMFFARVMGVALGLLVLSPFIYLYGRFILGWW